MVYYEEEREPVVSRCFLHSKEKQLDTFSFKNITEVDRSGFKMAFDLDSLMNYTIKINLKNK